MLALAKTIVLAVAALIAAAAACALLVIVYPAFGFPLFALAAAELIWLIVALLAIPMALLDRQRDWRAMALVPLSLILMAAYNQFMIGLAAARNIRLDEFTGALIGLTGGLVQYLPPLLSGPVPTASAGLACGILAALLLRPR